MAGWGGVRQVPVGQGKGNTSLTGKVWHGNARCGGARQGRDLTRLSVLLDGWLDTNGIKQQGGMRDDLLEILTQLRWAWPYAYGVPGRPLDAIRGYSLQPVDEDDPNKGDKDYVKGGKYDLGVGNDGARLAVQTVGRCLPRAEVMLNIGRLHCGARGVLTSFALVEHGEVRSFNLLVQSVRVVGRLCDELESDWYTADDLARRRAMRWAHKAAKELRIAVGALDRLRKGVVSEPSQPRCQNPHGCWALASAHEKEIRCPACAQWKRRHENNPERPNHLLRKEEEALGPRTQLNKRKANGLTGGDESLSHAWRGLR